MRSRPLEPRRLLRPLYVTRLALATGIFAAAVVSWGQTDPQVTLIASLSVFGALAGTILSAALSERRPVLVREPFLLAQAMLDAGLVTAIVHVTGGAESPFPALYILVIVFGTLVLGTRGAFLAAAFACTLYFGDVILLQRAAVNLALVLQFAVFAAVALAAWYIASRLREAQAGSAALAAQLARVRLEASDILRNIRGGIITVDARGTLLYANPSASALVGQDLARHTGEHAVTLLEPVSPALAGAIRAATESGERTSRAEGTIEQGGRTIAIGLDTTVSDAGAAAGRTATLIFQDISNQKRLDALHLRTERLEAVAELGASLAHEIRNPLASIRSAVEQLGRSPRATEDERSLAALIVRESDRLSRLLGEFLDFSRVQLGPMAVVDLCALVRGAAELMETHPDRPDGVRLHCDLPAEPVQLEGDEDLLHRIVFNLALNAVQASPAAGMVRLVVRGLPAGSAVPGGVLPSARAIVQVIDEGPGIAPEIRDRLFDPFITARPGGTGLGLSLVQRAVAAHGGQVHVDTDAYGTRMSVLLPLRQADRGDRA